ncbi:hypothetical protein [Micromonospora sp. C51]|uniref:hypothetical protein n=1 Tax=Micromonospora sp. C51 TaxID=2824879 RepID=UPI001B370C31|nr:hypothetical protein [Micromonospora sp. C51]
MTPRHPTPPARLALIMRLAAVEKIDIAANLMINKVVRGFGSVPCGGGGVA